MPKTEYPHFRYFVLCRKVGGIAEGATTLIGVLDTLSFFPSAFPLTLKVAVACGIVAPARLEFHADLVPVGYDAEGEITKPPGTRVHSLSATTTSGVSVVYGEVNLALPHPGMYGVLLGDPGGTFGPSRSVISEYRFEVNDKGHSAEWN